MGCWGAGIMESDTALDAECSYYDIAGVDSDGELSSRTAGCRARLEAVLPALRDAAAQAVAVGDRGDVLKVFDSLLNYPSNLSIAFKTRLQTVAHLLRVGDIDIDDHRLSLLVPSYDRACAYQVLATVLMRHGCAFSVELQQEMLDQMLNCDEHAMALDVDEGRYFTHDPRHQSRYRGRKAALAELWTALSTYDIRGGTERELRSRGLLEAFHAAQQKSHHVH